jgi:hypothetical protein
VPHCFFTPQHILTKPGKKDCQIFDTLQKYDETLSPLMHDIHAARLGAQM